MGNVVLTTGVFDCGMHAGHFHLLQTCREIAGTDGKVIVGINSDSSAEIYKRKPVMNEVNRSHLLNKLKLANEIFLIDQEHDIEDIIRNNHVDFYIKGSEWAGKKVTGQHLCKVIFLNPLTDIFGDQKISTSEIIKNIRTTNKPTPNPDTVSEAASKDKLI